MQAVGQKTCGSGWIKEGAPRSEMVTLTRAGFEYTETNPQALLREIRPGFSFHHIRIKFQEFKILGTNFFCRTWKKKRNIFILSSFCQVLNTPGISLWFLEQEILWEAPQSSTVLLSLTSWALAVTYLLLWVFQADCKLRQESDLFVFFELFSLTSEYWQLHPASRSARQKSIESFPHAVFRIPNWKEECQW